MCRAHRMSWIQPPGGGCSGGDENRTCGQVKPPLPRCSSQRALPTSPPLLSLDPGVWERPAGQLGTLVSVMRTLPPPPRCTHALPGCGGAGQWAEPRCRCWEVRLPAPWAGVCLPACCCPCGRPHVGRKEEVWVACVCVCVCAFDWARRALAGTQAQAFSTLAGRSEA